MYIECKAGQLSDVWVPVPLNYAIGFLSTDDGDYRKSEIPALLDSGETLERAGYQFRKCVTCIVTKG